MSTIKYILIVILFIIISSFIFSINKEATVPIYLTVSEYLKITGLSDEPRLDLYADVSNWLSWVEDDLDFSVESNIQYTIGVDFDVLDPDDWTEEILNDLLKFHKIIIQDPQGNTVIEKEGESGNGTSGTLQPGNDKYKLTFKLWVWGGIVFTFTEGQIGNIQITVSSI
ncbi:hypothetical protein [Petrotoga halophila]|uniref:Uncharacterized protein n=1 Tax=Petrotoga halophila DSM 16923 TaxID=1122953 RepID=A0A2S5EBI7_9BACT|nr:hypothetical protein [Petrotoga halophila]POZ90395.1 hypothetical protein AA81_11555 [Petrotoga halophila DSM 16923]